MERKNVDIRNLARKNNVAQWQIAELMDISEATLTRWLRFNLTPEKRGAILRAIRELSKDK